MQFFEDFRDLAESPEFESTQLSEANAVMFSNPVCGDVVLTKATLSSDGLLGFEYRAKGCWPVHSCLEFLGRKFVGQPLERVLSYQLSDFLAEIEAVPASKKHAFSLSYRGLKGAVTEAAAQLDGHRTQRRVY